MKRFIICFFVLLLFSCSVASADDPDFYAVRIPMGDDGFMIINMIIQPDKIYFVGVQFDYGDESGHPYTVKDGIISIQYEDGSVHSATEAAGKLFYQLLPEGPTIALNPVAAYDPSLTSSDSSFNIPESKATEKMLIPQGIYIAGEDFPVGAYRIERGVATGGGYVKIYESMDDINKPFGYIRDYYLGSLTDDGQAIGKFVFEKGYVLSAETTILLIPYEGLK